MDNLKFHYILLQIKGLRIVVRRAAGFCVSRKTKDSVDVCTGSCQWDHSGNTEFGKLFPFILYSKFL